MSLTLVASLLAACQATFPVTAPALEPIPSRPPALEVETARIGRSVEGRPIDATYAGSGPLTVLVIASIHGDESAGTWLVRELVARVEEHPGWLAGRRLIVVPVLNPDGLARGTRTNARGVDLNRDFPAANQRRDVAAPTEPESRALLERIEREAPDRIVVFHQAADRLDYDGPGEALARAMAAVSPLEVARMGARPGSLGSWAGVERGIPVITVELPRSADDLPPSQRWARYGELLRVALRYPDEAE